MTTDEAAQWMLEQLADRKILDQDYSAYHIYRMDADLVYQNQNGNLALKKEVLDSFRKLTEENDVVWSRSSRHWRYRHKHDRPGRMQD